MAPSLQELIDFLLDEVALCGNQGATPTDVLKAIREFYHKASEDAQRHQAVDDRFKAKVWSWLARNPEVSVGKNKEWNHLSLEEVIQLEPQASEAGGVVLKTEPSEDHSQNNDSLATSASQVRVFVSKERTWYAVTGHEPDDTKVVPLEFVLLSIIASHKSNGIAQTDLVKLSGQDKRSVPRRTDYLQQKGYIEKRAIQVKAARTSLCTLRRFVRPTARKPTEQKSQEAAQAMDLEAFVKRLFEILQEFRLITRNDLKRILGFDDAWRWRILSRALRKFERIGVLKRVRAKSQYEKLHPCVMLLRDPTTKDLELFHEYNGDILDKYGADDRAELDEDMELDVAGKGEPSGVDEDAIELKKDEQVEDVARIVPSWTPDRTLNNQIFDIVQRTGTAGITNHNINRICFGSFFRRPTESLLHRLVDCWQVSQPPHLRHLAIVRDTAIERTVIYYVHYTANDFAKLVEAGEASWEAVEFSGKKKKANDFTIPPVDAIAQLDEYGFPQTAHFPKILKGGNATLLEGIMARKPADYVLSTSDPLVNQLENGAYVIQSGPGKLPPGGVQRFQASFRHKGRPKGSVNRSSRLRLEKSQKTPDVDGNDNVVEESVPVLPLTRRVNNKYDSLKGLSKKEKLEALGLDETWTEYNVLLMDRPTPGVYVTPRGRRRPVGKRQGRPRQSRIAVFKSPKLTSLPWFVKDTDESDNEPAGMAKGAIPASRAPDSTAPDATSSAISLEERLPHGTIEETQVTTKTPRRAKRNQAALDSPELLTSPSRTNRSETPSGRPSKQRRLHNSRKDNDPLVSVPTEETLPEQTVLGRPEDVNIATVPERMPKSSAVHRLEGEENQATPSKRRRLGSSEQTEIRDSSPVPRTQVARESSVQLTSFVARETPKTVDGQQSETPKLIVEKGGSIGVLRRKIVMEIVEKAGGAYPTGSALWNPFTTAWLKMNYKEKPDMRTIKSTVKSLVDTGRLRQLTFSGKDSKGVMVTKTVLTKPDMSPDDPLVKEMQDKTLASDPRDPRPFFSPHVPMDPELSRSGARPYIHKFALPVEPGAVVKLQRKPAAILAEEERTRRRIHKRLVKNMEQEAGAHEGAGPGYGPKRLMKIQRRPMQDSSANAQTSISRPHAVGEPGRKREPYKPREPGGIKRLVKTMSSIRAYAMLMNPEQKYHASTGTFSTEYRSATVRKPRQVAETPAANVVEIANQLAQLIHLAPPPGRTKATSDQSFFSAVDGILGWEIEHQDFFQANLKGLPFVNQTFHGEFHTEPIQGDIRFENDELAPAALPPRSPMATRKRAAFLAPEPLRQTVKQPIQERRLAKVDGAPIVDKGISPAARRLARRQRHTRPLPEDMARKLMLAIVAVRVLAGGTEGRVIDWGLVALAFPDHDPKLIDDRARHVLSKSRLQVMKMLRDFQERFIEAYAKDEVPPIDYGNLVSYDWPGVVEWANTELDASVSEKLPDLPATREQFDSVFELREESMNDDLWQINPGTTVNQKRRHMAEIPFAVLVDEKPSVPSRRKTELARLDVTKTWVRANIVAPEETYRPAEAKQTLERFGESLISSATQSLLTERVIGMGNRGRIAPGRNYDITDHFLQILTRKRTIDSTQLRRAAHFKTTILDPQLQRTGVFSVQYHADDGHILALINLATTGRITLRPCDPPRDRFGLTEGGYLTRQIDKTRLHFAIEVRPHASYVYGNPVADRAATVTRPLPQPSQVAGFPPKIPLWFDIHGALVPRLWEMIVGSVLGCLAMRQGASAEIVSGMIKPTMGAWETLLLLEWLAEVGVVRCCYGNGEQAGWVLLEWWWMVLP